MAQKNTAAFNKKQAVLPEQDEDAAIRVMPQIGGSTRGSISSGTSPTTLEATDANGNQNRGMILPFEPHSITFDNVKYSVDMPAVCLTSNEKHP